MSEVYKRVWEIVQQKHGLPHFTESLVRDVIGAYVDVLCENLAENGKVVLKNFGTVTTKVKRNYYKKPFVCGEHNNLVTPNTLRVEGKIRLGKKARQMTVEKVEQEAGMTKLGVSTIPTEDNDKIAQTKQVQYCPICGKEAVTASGQLQCPVHGTAPFER